MRLPIPFSADRGTAEQVILDAARRHTAPTTDLGEEASKELEPRVHYRITDNRREMAVRFITEDHGVRKVKGAMSREILEGIDAAKIGIASGAYEVVGMPELKVRIAGDGAPQ